MATENLRASAGSGLLWGVGFTLTRDIIQFLTMLIMVRLLSPQIYGEQALAQTIIGFIAVASVKTLAKYPLQARDPEQFDWEVHFTVGAVINLVAFAITNAVGLVILFFGGAKLATTGQVVLFLSPIFLLEIACTYYDAWLVAHHRWKRLRLLHLTGSITGACLGLLLAWIGWGVFALASTSILFGIPMAFDFLFLAEERPRFVISRFREYTQGAKFGANRAVSAALGTGRGLVESSAMSSFFGFATLGSFSRALGLAQISTGRVGPVVVTTLYGVLTRAEASSERFRRFSALLFQGVVWVSFPTAAFLAFEARPIVDLLYGARWGGVSPLLPLASVLLALRGVSSTLNQIMLGNLQTGTCLRIDAAAAVVGLAAIPITLPFGAAAYLSALLVCEMVILVATIILAERGGAITTAAVLHLSAPCLVATVTAGLTLKVFSLTLWTPTAPWYYLAGGIAAHAAVFAVAYATVLRFCAPKAMAAMLDALPIHARARDSVARLFAIPIANR